MDYNKLTACLAGIFGGTGKGITLMMTAQAQITISIMMSVAFYAAVSALSALVVKMFAEWIIRTVKGKIKNYHNGKRR